MKKTYLAPQLCQIEFLLEDELMLSVPFDPPSILFPDQGSDDDAYELPNISLY